MKGWAQSAAIGLAVFAVFCVARAANDSPSGRAARGDSKATSSLTYTRDIAPILFRSCAPCHRPGEAAPFSLLTYEDAKSHARLIEELTKRRTIQNLRMICGFRMRTSHGCVSGPKAVRRREIRRTCRLRRNLWKAGNSASRIWL